MPNGYSPVSLSLSSPYNVFGASVSAVPCSLPGKLSANGARNMVIGFSTSGVTSTTGITVKLQQADLDDQWVDVAGKTQTVTGNTRYYIRVAEVADTAVVPLLCKIRLVVTTGTGDAVTISSVQLLNDL